MAGVKIAPDGIETWNPAFDVTPANLITAIVTDKGVIRPAEGVSSDAKVFDVKAFIVSANQVHVCVFRLYLFCVTEGLMIRGFRISGPGGPYSVQIRYITL